MINSNETKINNDRVSISKACYSLKSMKCKISILLSCVVYMEIE